MNKIPDSKLGERLKLIRKSMGLTQGELCKRSGVAQSEIWHYENGTKNPSFISLHKLNVGLNYVGLDYLVYGNDNPGKYIELIKEKIEEVKELLK